MGHIAAADIYLKEFTDQMSAEITAILRARSSTLSETRKGRVWHLGFSESGIHMVVTVGATEKRLYDLEDDLLELGHFPEEYPECLNIVCARGREVDLSACAELCEVLHSALESITSGAKLQH